MRKRSTVGPISISVLFGVFLFVLGIPEAFAELAPYKPLVNLPGIQGGSTSIPAFINRVYIFTIVIGSLFGVVKIALAGAKYSMGDVITNKEEAKKDIKGVLLGLVVLLAPWIVLNTIYPGLLNLDFTKNITNVGVPMPTEAGRNIVPEGYAKESCVVGSEIEITTSATAVAVGTGVLATAGCAWAGPGALVCGSVGVAVGALSAFLAEGGLHTDESCKDYLDCGDKEGGVLKLETNNKYTCTYEREVEEVEVECEINPDAQLPSGKTPEEICRERCDEFGGTMDENFTCNYTKYTDG